MLGIILQARMGSTRLPGKILMKIGDKTLLAHILFRLTFLRHEAQFVIATTTLSLDDIVTDFCRSHAVECFRGSERDVLDRYYQCAVMHGFSHIVRLTGDNPFTDIEELDNLIDLHLQTGADYTHSFGVLPVGVGAEIFTMRALADSHLKGTKDNHREHVNEYIQEHPDLFDIRTLSVPVQKRRPDIRLTVDTPEDLARMSFIIQHAGSAFITTEEAIELCSRFA